MSSSFMMYPRSWVDCDYSSGGGSDLDTDAESGISISSFSASSSSASLEDVLGASRESLQTRGRKFSLATYNILTDKCIRAGEYLYCPPELRYMETRHAAILAEVKAMDPDVVCFQEVDGDNYRSRLACGMKSLGYAGLLHERVDDQGMALFWKERCFELMQQKHCLLHHLAETYIQLSSLSFSERAAVRQAIVRPEAVLLVRLQHALSGQQVAIANMHVTWSQLKYPALQALQIAVAVNELADFSRGYDCCAQLICGDFNSPPGSIPYKLMMTGALDRQSIDSLNADCALDSVERLLAVDLFHVLPLVYVLKLPLRSAYKTTLQCEPEVTNCDEAGQGYLCQLCLDYICFCPDSLDVTGVLDLPPTEAVTRHHALPSAHFPSDHLPLMAELVFK